MLETSVLIGCWWVSGWIWLIVGVGRAMHCLNGLLIGAGDFVCDESLVGCDEMDEAIGVGRSVVGVPGSWLIRTGTSKLGGVTGGCIEPAARTDKAKYKSFSV